MTGEEELTYRLSLRLSKSPTELMEELTTVDLIRYAHLLEQEWHENQKQDWYAAQQAYETFCVAFRVWGKKPPANLEIKHFLMKFGKPDAVNRKLIDDAVSDLERQQHLDMQKMYWLAAVGLDPLTGKPVDDGIPLQTRRSPDMLPEAGISPQNASPGRFPAPSAPPTPAAGPGFTPRGRSGRMKRR
jgi:hypothetical protein